MTATTATREIRVRDGAVLQVLEAGPRHGSAVLLVHGFPESALSWRFQLPALAQAGCHALAVDLRGHGGSALTPPGDAYAMREIVHDLIDVLDAFGIARAVWVGHDWGGRTVWQAALRCPGRVDAVVAVNAVFTPREPRPPVDRSPPERFSFLRYFQGEVAGRELDADVERSLHFFLAWLYGTADATTVRWLHAGRPASASLFHGLQVPPGRPPWLDDAAWQAGVLQYRRTGFAGGLERYRQMTRDWADAQGLPDEVAAPALFIGGASDSAVMFQDRAAMRRHVPRLVERLLPDAGHAVHQQCATAVNETMLGFLADLQRGRTAMDRSRPSSSARSGGFTR